MKPELYTRVVLRWDVPAEGLRRGDLAWVVDYLDHPAGKEEGAILESDLTQALIESVDGLTAFLLLSSIRRCVR